MFLGKPRKREWRGSWEAIRGAKCLCREGAECRGAVGAEGARTKMGVRIVLVKINKYS